MEMEKKRAMNMLVMVADYANARHANDIVTLMNCYAMDPMGGGIGMDEHVKDNLVSMLATIPNAFTILCHIDGAPAGLVNCLQGFSTFKCKPLINIHDVIVASDYRGSGVCHTMLELVETRARERGCCKLTLEVLEGNKTAQNAYTRFGFSGYELDPALGKALFWEKAL